MTVTLLVVNELSSVLFFGRLATAATGLTIILELFAGHATLATNPSIEVKGVSPACLSKVMGPTL